MQTAPRHLVHPRDEIIDAIERIYRYRMTTTSGGNLSIRDGGDVWITPARLDKGTLCRDDVVCVRSDGSIAGPHQPSSEYPFHRAIYDARPDLGAIVHAHPVALVAFSVCRRVPNTRLFHQARHICGEVGFAPYALPGSAALGKNIAEVFRAGHRSVVLENHGVVVGGADLREAFARFETLEFTARTVLKARQLGEVRYLNDREAMLPQSRTPLEEFTPPPPTETERELRRQLCDFVRRGYRQRLLISTEGSFSARLDDESFLITPTGFDRREIELDDLVLVRGGRSEAGRSPSGAARLHAAIYARHPRFRSIVNASPVNATAFSVTAAALDSRTIPESYLFLKDVARIPYGLQFGDGREIAEAGVSPENPIALIENDGVLVCGTSVLDAFDRLEVLETTAEALVDARALGEVTPMPPAVIDELKKAFAGM